MNRLKRAFLVFVFPVLTLVATAPSVSAVEVGEKPQISLSQTGFSQFQFTSVRWDSQGKSFPSYSPGHILLWAV